MVESTMVLSWRLSGGGQLTWYVASELYLLCNVNEHDAELSSISRKDSREEALEQSSHPAT